MDAVCELCRNTQGGMDEGFEALRSRHHGTEGATVSQYRGRYSMKLWLTPIPLVYDARCEGDVETVWVQVLTWYMN